MSDATTTTSGSSSSSGAENAEDVHDYWYPATDESETESEAETVTEGGEAVLAADAEDDATESEASYDDAAESEASYDDDSDGGESINSQVDGDESTQASISSQEDGEESTRSSITSQDGEQSTSESSDASDSGVELGADDVERSQCAWQAPPAEPSGGELEPFVSACEDYVDYALRAPSAESRDDMLHAIWYYADYYELVAGNWLCFVPAVAARAFWELVVDANERGQLGGYAELRSRTGGPGGERCVAVHVPDYRDVAQVAGVLRRLRALAAPHDAQIRTFKAKALTHLGVYKDGGNAPLASLGFRSLPVPPVIAHLLPNAHLQQEARRRRRRARGGGGGGGGANHFNAPHYANADYHGRPHVPSLPNGQRTSDEVSAGWIYHANRPAAVYQPSDWGRQHTTAYVAERLSEAQGAAARGETLSPAAKRRLCESLWSYAARHDSTVGKWAVYPRAAHADALWLALCAANDRGELGGCIKVGEHNARTDAYMICVYCNDFTDVADCTRILHRVARIAARHHTPVVANFKPDFLTYVRAYRSHVLGYEHGIYQLARLGLARYWPNPELKAALDALKRADYE